MSRAPTSSVPELRSANPQGHALAPTAQLANSNIAGLKVLHCKTLLKMNLFDTGGRILYLLNLAIILLVSVIGVSLLKETVLLLELTSHRLGLNTKTTKSWYKSQKKEEW